MSYQKISYTLLIILIIGSLIYSVNSRILQQQNHLKKHHLGFINGPILFTSPHSRKVYRGGQYYGGQEKKQSLRIHQRQKYASWIAVQLAHKVTQYPSSFCTWGEGPVVTTEWDPNYLLDTMFGVSQFHLGLHAWAGVYSNCHLLHIDIHGKSDREVCDIDIGIKSIEMHWGQKDPLLQRLRNYFNTFSQIFWYSDLPQCKFNTNGLFKGYWRKYKTWKPDRHSMTQQAIQLGIPSFQIQLPRSVRNQLYSNSTFFNAFAYGIKKLHDNVIIPYYQNNQKKVPLSFNSGYRNLYNVTVFSNQQAQVVREQLYDMES